MLKESIVALPVMWSANTSATSMQMRQHYLDNFSLVNCITPSKQASWYWRHMNQVLPSVMVNRAGRHRPLERAHIDPSIVSNMVFNGSPLHSLIKGEAAPVESIMIISDGKVIFEHFNMPYNTKHAWMGNAKVIAGTLIAMLEDEGKMDVQQPLSAYLPELEDKDWGGIRVIDILNMQSGIDAQENNPAALTNVYISKLFFSAIGEIPNYYDTLINIPRKQNAPLAFEYSSANSQILGLLVARLEHKTLADSFEQRIWSKAGMTADSYFSLSPDGYELVNGLFTSNTEDMARYAMLYTDCWQQTSDSRIISEKLVKRIQHSVSPGVYTASSTAASLLSMFPDEPCGGSYQFDAVWDDGDLFKGSPSGQGMYISPRKNTIAVWFSNRIEGNNVAGYMRNLVCDA